MSEELKPVKCGCGGEPVVGHIEKTSYLPKDRWYIGCPKCDICTGIYDTKVEVIEAWNTAMNGLLPEGDPQKNVGVAITNSTEPEQKTFHVIDKTTGKEADPYEIALNEDWAKSLCYCDMEGFAILEDGTLILVDECGRFEFIQENDRFEIVWDEVNNG